MRDMESESVTLDVPRWVNNFFKRQAKRRAITKSAVVREALMEHAEKSGAVNPAKRQSEVHHD